MFNLLLKTLMGVKSKLHYVFVVQHDKKLVRGKFK